MFKSLCTREKALLKLREGSFTALLGRFGPRHGCRTASSLHLQIKSHFWSPSTMIHHAAGEGAWCPVTAWYLDTDWLSARLIPSSSQIVIIMTCVHNHCDGEIIVLSAPRDTLAIIASCCTCVLVRASNEPSRRLKFYKHKEGSTRIYGNQKSMPIHFDFCNSTSISHWFTMG